VLDADGKHLQADGYISLAILAGVLVIWVTGIRVLDNVFAIAAAIFISYTGIKLMRRSLSGIMDETDAHIISSIVAYLNTRRKPQWIDIHNMREILYGSALHVDCHVTLPWYYTLEQTHFEIDQIETLINESSEFPVEVFIHADPCLPVCCRLCQMDDCAVRRHTFEKKIDWNFSNATVNRKHQLEEAIE
jgi:divalent metal cation (Fe/Co/Zn/Cd) transporter